MAPYLKNSGNSRGSTLVGGLLVVLLLGYLGSSLISLNSSDDITSAHDLEGVQAEHVGVAGLEYARIRLDYGQSPVVAGQPLGYGTFNITTDPQARLIQVESNVGEAVRVQSITANFSNDCVGIDTSDAHSSGNDLLDVRLAKTCNSISTVSRIKITWNWDPCVTQSTYSAENNLSDCPVTTGNAHVSGVGFSGQTVYDPSQNIGSPPSPGADSGIEIDMIDSNMAGNGAYTFAGPSFPIRFDQPHPGKGLYTIVVSFADGSTASNTFQDPTAAYVPSFDVDNGRVDINPNQNVSVEIIGSAITYGAGGPEIPVTVELGTTSGTTTTYTSLFNGRDVDGGEIYTTTSGPGKIFSIRATGRYCSFYARYSSTNMAQVKTLVNGNRAPPLQGFGGQRPITEFLASYLSADGTVALSPNQVIMLFELGVNVTRYPGSPAADFQDLVILFTITPQ